MQRSERRIFLRDQLASSPQVETGEQYSKFKQKGVQSCFRGLARVGVGSRGWYIGFDRRVWILFSVKENHWGILSRQTIAYDLYF